MPLECLMTSVVNFSVTDYANYLPIELTGSILPWNTQEFGNNEAKILH
jgi:hypothetical protein